MEASIPFRKIQPFQAPKALVCAYCSSQSVSVCNCELEAFRGCGTPFCADHGIFHEVLQVGLLPKTIPESKEAENSILRARVALKVDALREADSKSFRICFPCAESRGLLSTIQWKARILLGTLFLLFGILVGLKVLGAEDRKCRLGSYYSLLDGCQSILGNLSIVELNEWTMFQNPGALFCSEMQAPRGKLSLRCMCPATYPEMLRSSIDGTLVQESSCQSPVCPPDGENYITNDGRCLKATSGLTNFPPFDTGFTAEDGTPARCPMNAYFVKSRQACISGQTFTSTGYYFQMEKHRVRNCLFTRYSTSRKSGCSSLRVLPRAGSESFPNYLSPIKSIDCPKAQFPLAEKQSQDFNSLGYYTTSEDPFGYRWCPSQTPAGGFSRECLWHEMGIRFQVGCRSPCTPFREQWDFLTRQCVPAESDCEARGLVQSSNGECQ